MKLSDLLQNVTQNTASIDGVRWYPVRPMTAENTFFMQRVKAAWRVLAGTSDAIEWDYPTESKTPNDLGNRRAAFGASVLTDGLCPGGTGKRNCDGNTN